jgi:ribose transport system substrate-binding protein
VKLKFNLLLAAGLVALTGALATGAGSAVPSADVAFVGADLVDPYYLTMKCGAFDAARKFNVKLSWQGTNGVDYQPELTIFNAAVQKKPQAIIVAPFNPEAFVQPVQSAMSSGIPVVTVDGSLSKKVEVSNIRTDNLVVGGLAGDGMGKAIGGKGEVGIISFAPDIPVQADRVNGFKNALKKHYPNVKVVAVEYGGADASKAAQKAAAIIQAHPNIAGLYGTDTSDAEGAASAILAAGKRGKIKLVGYDAGPKQVKDLKSGLYDGLAAQAPYDVGYKSVQLAAQLARGQAKKGSVPYFQPTGGAYVTRENLNQPNIKKFLYRPTCS